MKDIKLLHENCIDFMGGVSNNTFDCIITSPPYNMNLRIRDGKYISRCTNKNYTKEFSTKYSNYSDDLPLAEYYEFLDTVISECLRISKLTFFNIQMITGNKIPLFQLIGKYAENIKEIIIWDKVNAIPAMHEGTLNSQFEFILVLDNQKPYNRTFDIFNFDRGTLSNIWHIEKEIKKDFKFKASFPEKLVYKILTNFTKESDKIFDPFLGSGTTAVVCAKLDREFTGTEIDSDTYKLAKERVDRTIKDCKTLLF